jgi:hypothetical protein
LTSMVANMAMWLPRIPGSAGPGLLNREACVRSYVYGSQYDKDLSEA